jgi:hypothetical protein
MADNGISDSEMERIASQATVGVSRVDPTTEAGRKRKFQRKRLKGLLKDS